MDVPMEARIARIESDIAHLRTDVADIKVDVRTRFDKMDARIDRLDAKVDSIGTRVDAKIDGVKDSLAAAKTWAFFLYVALATAMLGTMARGFGWI